MDMKVSVEFTVKGTKIKLTLEEAMELKKALEDMIPKERWPIVTTPYWKPWHWEQPYYVTTYGSTSGAFSLQAKCEDAVQK